MSRRALKPTVEFDGKVYSLRSSKVEIPDLTAMSRFAALTWLIKHTYPRGTNHRRPNLLAGLAGAISVGAK